MSDVSSPAPAAPAATSSSPSTKSAPPTSGAPKSTVSPGTPGGTSGGGQNSAPASKELPHGGSDASDSRAKAESENNHPDAQPGETKAETVQRLKFKGKVHGKEIERELSPEEVQLYLQKGFGADETFQEGANIRKTFAQLQKALKEDPFEALKDPAFGIDLEELAVQHLARKFQAEELQKADPKAYELQQYKEKVARYEAEEKARTEREREESQRIAAEKMWAETQKQWDAELEKSGLKGNRQLHIRMAQIAQKLVDNKLDMAPNYIVAELRNELAEEHRMLMGGLKGESLANFLGPDVVAEVAALQLARAQAGKPVQKPIEAPVAPAKTEKDDELPKPQASLRSYGDFLRSK